MAGGGSLESDLSCLHSFDSLVTGLRIYSFGNILISQFKLVQYRYANDSLYIESLVQDRSILILSLIINFGRLQIVCWEKSIRLYYPLHFLPKT